MNLCLDLATKDSMTCSCPAISDKVEDTGRDKVFLKEPMYITASLLPLAAQGTTVYIDYPAPFHGLSGEAAVSRAQHRMIICAKGSLFPNRRNESKDCFLGVTAPTTRWGGNVESLFSILEEEITTVY